MLCDFITVNTYIVLICWEIQVIVIVITAVECALFHNYNFGFFAIYFDIRDTDSQLRQFSYASQDNQIMYQTVTPSIYICSLVRILSETCVVINHLIVPCAGLAQFSLNIVHKGGLKQHDSPLVCSLVDMMDVHLHICQDHNNTTYIATCSLFTSQLD